MKIIAGLIICCVFILTKSMALSEAATSIYNPRFTLEIIDRGQMEQGGSPHEYAFPRNLIVEVFWRCARESKFLDIETIHKEASIEIDIQLDGKVTRAELIAPANDAYWNAVLDAFSKCDSLERAFVLKSVSGWSNIKAELR